MITRRRCCCGGCLGCLPCQIPLQGLQLSWDGTGIGGGFDAPASAMLTYDPGVFDLQGLKWHSPTDSFIVIIPAFPHDIGYRARFGCATDNTCITLAIDRYSITESGPVLVDTLYSSCDGLADFTCYPFHLHWSSTDGGNIYVIDSATIPTKCDLCHPCELPKTDLTITLVATSTTFPYVSSLPDKWYIPCGSDVVTGFYELTMSCSPGHTVSMSVRNWWEGCGNGSPDDWPATLVDYTCSPVHLHFHVLDPTLLGGDFELYVDG